MSTALYYFTGTGNSLVIARSLAKELGGAELTGLPKAIKDGAVAKADCVGIVFPVYMFGEPLIVAEFCRKVTVPAGAYVFAVTTCGGMPGATTVHIRDLLGARGIKLAAGFVVVMPGNYTPLYGAQAEGKQKSLFEKAAKKVSEIAAIVRAKQEGPMETSNFLVNAILSGFMYKKGSARIPTMDARFRVEPQCNSCGTCEKVCPVGNVRMTEGRPVWQGRCEQCMACLQWCPTEAIQYGNSTAGRKRYHHPDVELRDIIAQKN